MRNRIDNILEERFGKPIGDYAGEPLVGVRDEREESINVSEVIEECKTCEMLPVEDQCGCGEEKREGCGMPVSQCSCPRQDVCPMCGMMRIPTGLSMGPSCSCGMYEGKGSGPSKRTAKKILRGAKSFSQKMKRVSGWAEDPAAGAMWMTMKAGLKPHGR